jgi:hypothetical protein
VVGNILASGTITPSDMRLKSNIKPIAPALGNLLKLNPVSYTKKFSLSKDEKGSIDEMGFIAQELQKIYPEIVMEGKDEFKTLAVNYTSLIPVLVKSIQEQQVQINAKTAELDAKTVELNQLRELIREMDLRLKNLEKK